MSINGIIDERAKQILIENIYKGKGYINNLDPVPVETYEKMQVSGADIIIPENIKDGEVILGVTGSYDGEASLSFNTVAYTYQQAQEFIQEHGYNIDLRYYPFFYFTNISKGLEANQYYAITQAEYNFDIGYEDHGNKFIVIEPDKMVLNYSGDRAEKIDNLTSYGDEQGKRYHINNINLYIVEKLSDRVYKVIDKGSNKLNALYPLGISVQREEESTTVELIENGEIVNTYSGYYIILKDTLYKHTYQMRVIAPEKVCWGIIDPDQYRHEDFQIDYQYPTYFKPEELPSVRIYMVSEDSERVLNKAGLPFVCDSYDRITEDVVLCNKELYLRTDEQIESGMIVFEIYNSSTDTTYTYTASYHDKDGEHYWSIDLDAKDTEDILAGDTNTVITITCKNEPLSTSTYIRDNNSQVPFVLTDSNGNELPSGSTLEEGDEYMIKNSSGNLPKYSAIYINDELYRRLDSEAEFESFRMSAEYISEDDETVIRVDLETPPSARIHIDNASSKSVEIQKRSRMGTMFTWNTIEGGSCMPMQSIDVEVTSGSDQYYRIITHSNAIEATLNAESVYHGSPVDNISMDVVDLGSMTWVLTKNELGMMQGAFSLSSNDDISFTITTRAQDYITIDNTNGTGTVYISGDSPFGSWSWTVMSGTTYNLSAQQYMMTPVVNFVISSENDATWQAKDSEEIITLSKSGNTILDPNGNSQWYIPDSTETGYMGTITITSSGPTPPTPGKTYITVDNKKGNTKIYIEGSSSGTSVEAYSQASFETSGTTRYQLSGKPQGGATVTFTGTYNGKYRSNSNINIYSGYLVNPETSEYDWMSGANGTITIVTWKK